MYDKILELRIANAQVIVNYAAFLEENQYFEESFKVGNTLLSIARTNCLLLQVYERGVELFTFPVSFEIWNIYLAKFIKRYVSLMRQKYCSIPHTSTRAARKSNEPGTYSSKLWRNVHPSHASQYS